MLGVVKGLEELSAEIRLYWAYTPCFGQKVALYFYKRGEKLGSRTPSKLWCAEISLERRQGGEVWGKVEWSDQVMVVDQSEFTVSVSVMV